MPTPRASPTQLLHLKAETGGISSTDWGVYFLFGGVILPTTCLLFSAAPIFISTTLMGCIKQLEMVLIPIYGYLYEGEIPRTEAILGASFLWSRCSCTAYFNGWMRREKEAESGPCNGRIFAWQRRKPWGRILSCRTRYRLSINSSNPNKSQHRLYTTIYTMHAHLTS